MIRFHTRHTAFAALATLPLLAAACADNGNTGPDDADPVVTVSGVEDGGSYAPPVTITIQVAPGSYSATLNGAPFISGQSVAQPGDYTLVVTGRNGTARVTETIEFTVESFGTGDVLIVRMFDLRTGTGSDAATRAPGDAILITDSSSAGQFHALIDAGARDNVDTYPRDRLVQLGVDTLRFMQLTHAHADHFAGMDDILNSAIHVTSFIHNGQTRALDSYNAVLSAANQRADTVTQLAGSATRTLELGGGSVPTMVTMIPPHPDYDGAVGNDGTVINEGSIGTLITHGAFRMYFTGDGQDAANARWRLDFAGLSGNVDVLKVGHHAANDATNQLWLNHSSFEVAAASANGTTHPRIGALDRLDNVSPVIYCTHVHGEIRITVDEGGVYTVTVEKNAGAACTPGSTANTSPTDE